MPDAAFGVGRSLANDSGGKGLGGPAHEWVVEEKESLWSNDGLAALTDNQAGVSVIEQPAEIGRVRRRPRGHEIKGPPRDGQIAEGQAAACTIQASGYRQEAIA